MKNEILTTLLIAIFSIMVTAVASADESRNGEAMECERTRHLTSSRHFHIKCQPVDEAAELAAAEDREPACKRVRHLTSTRHFRPGCQAVNSVTADKVAYNDEEPRCERTRQLTSTRHFRIRCDKPAEGAIEIGAKAEENRGGAAVNDQTPG